MNSLRINFSAPTGAELSSVEFTSAGKETRRSVRGRGESVFSTPYTFQWTGAVKAFAVLCIRARIFGAAHATIAGEDDSIASALDYALSKPPRWITEMFGQLPDGTARAKRMFRRSNPERKRGGPVVISFNPEWISTERIVIAVGGRIVDDVDQLRALLQSFEELFRVPSAESARESLALEAGPTNLEDHIDSGEIEFLRSIYQNELRSSLTRSNVFSRAWTSQQVSQLSHDPLFKKLVPNPSSSFATMRDGELGAVRLGTADESVIRRELSRPDRPIKIVSSAVTTGVLALARYLRDVKRYNIEIDCFYPYGTEVVDQLMREKDYDGPILAATGLGPSAVLLNNRKYGFAPLMIGPSLSHRTVRYTAGAVDNDNLKGECLIVSDNPTSVLFYYEGLALQNVINRKALSLRHCEPDEVMRESLSGAGQLSLLWFPHFALHHRWSRATVINCDPLADAFREITVILANDYIRSNDKLHFAIKVALYDAWLTCLEEPEVMRRLVNAMVSDAAYMKFIKRCAGYRYFAEYARKCA